MSALGKVLMAIFALGTLIGVPGTLFFYNRAVEYQVREVTYQQQLVEAQKELRTTRVKAPEAEKKAEVKAVPASVTERRRVSLEEELRNISREIRRAFREGRMNDARRAGERGARLTQRFRVVCGDPAGDEVWRGDGMSVVVPPEASLVWFVREPEG